MRNTDIVKGMYEAFGRGDVASIIGALSADVNWITPGPKSIPYAGTYRGQDGAMRFFQKLAETCELDPFMPSQFVEQGDTVVALGSYTGRTKPGNRPLASSFAMVFKLKDG